MLQVGLEKIFGTLCTLRASLVTEYVPLIVSNGRIVCQLRQDLSYEVHAAQNLSDTKELKIYGRNMEVKDRVKYLRVIVDT